jgi:protein-tyrosine phosphatase
MNATLYPIIGLPAGRLAILARPRAGDWLRDETRSWRASGIDVIVSLLEDEEIAELGLDEEELACQAATLQFHRFPIPDRGVPGSIVDFTRFVDTLCQEIRAGRGVGVHCRMGLGRSAMVVACVLRRLGVGLEEAWGQVASARGMSVPDTAEQKAWVREWQSSSVVGTTFEIGRQSPALQKEH